MHGATLTASSSSSSSLFDMTYTLREGNITLSADELIKFVKQLNESFSRIQDLVDKYAYEQEKSDHTYLRRLTRYRFCNFNEIYESNLLRNIGKALFPF